VGPQGSARDQGATLRTPSGRPKGRRRGSSRRRSGGERRCRKAAPKPLEIPRMTTLILNPRGKDGGRPPARVAGRGEAKTRKLGRLPGESPGTEVRNVSAEAKAVRLLERSLGTLFLFPAPLSSFLPISLPGIGRPTWPAWRRNRKRKRASGSKEVLVIPVRFFARRNCHRQMILLRRDRAEEH
jgi:hypothetical protein